MKFTPGQLRTAIGLSKETFRHWKRILPAYAGDNGKGPRFSPGDVIASSVLRHVTEDCGIRIGHLANVSTMIFSICNENSWVVLQDRILVLDASRNTCALFENTSRIPTDSTVVVCPVGPIIQALQDALMQSHPVREQTRFHFPPTPVGPEPAVRSRAK